MTIAGIEPMSVFWSAVGGFLVGGFWYGALSRAWLDAVGLTEEQIKRRPNAVPFLIAFLGNLVIGFGLAVLIRTTGQASLSSGAMLGALVCAGFVLSTLAVNHSFQNARRVLTLIDGGHWLGVFIVQGAMLGWLMAG